MSPQPPAPTADKGKTDAEKKAEAEAEAAADKAWDELVERASTTGGESPQTQVKRAVALEAQRAALAEKIAKNRTYLRLMDENEELNEDQQEFADVFYREKASGERSSAEEIKATKRAREAARRSNSKS